MSDRLLTAEEVAARLNVPLCMAWKLGRETLAPAVVRIGSRTMRFRESLVDAYIDAGGRDSLREPEHVVTA